MLGDRLDNGEVMSPEDQPGLRELLEHARYLVALLEDCHPGFLAWRAQLADTLREIDKYHPDGARDATTSSSQKLPGSQGHDSRV